MQRSTPNNHARFGGHHLDNIMHEFRVYIGQRYVGTVMADDHLQAVDRARVKYRFGVNARVRVSRIDQF